MACKPSAWLFDVMHLYYSNGVAAWELNNLLSRLPSIGLTLEVLQDALCSAPWQRGSGRKASKSWLKGLLHASLFTGDSYRGDASNLMALLPLLYYYLHQTVEKANLLVNEMKSFRLLMQIHQELRAIQWSQKRLDTSRLATLQSQHQEKFLLAYTHCKPKHHYRFHLPQQLEAEQCYIDCMAMEKQHKKYKSLVSADRFGNCARGVYNNEGKYSSVLLERILANHLKALETFQFKSGLLPPLKTSYDLQGNRLTTSKRAIIRETQVGVGDVLLHGKVSGIVLDLFTLVSDERVQVRFNILQPIRHDVSSSRWKKTHVYEVLVESDIGRRPTFWALEDNDEVLCL